MALAGPVLGSVGAFLCYLVASSGGGPLWFALAYAGFFINLFNLIPLRPLDGGRVVRLVSPRLWFVGLPILVAVFLWRPSPLLLIVALLAAPDLWAALRGRTEPVVAPMAMRWRVGGAYLGLVPLLSVMAFEVHQHPALGR